MDSDKTFQSKIFILILKIIILTAILLFIFWLGMFIGQKKGQFRYARRESYCCNILSFYSNSRPNFLPPEHLKGMLGKQSSVNTYGIIGRILKISDNKLVVLDRDGIEKTVIVSQETIIKYFQKTISIKDLVINNMIAVIGEPKENGQIEARFIRVLPQPENNILP